MKKRLYLAYGSNLNIRQMFYRCPTARVFGTAVINDYELLFKGSMTGSYLTIEQKQGSSVPVAVWEVTENDEQALDRYEGFPDFYYKKEITLPISSIKNGHEQTGECFVHVMHEERPLGIPSLAYVNVCKQGYSDFGFDELFIRKALKRSKEGMKNG